MEKVRIELQDISKSYYSETTVTQALRKISLTFLESEFVAVTGESGSGKSTLLNIIGGMDTFDDGEMFVDGEPTFQYDEQDWEEYRRSKIGYVFQDYSLVGHYTALTNVMSALLVIGEEQKQAEETAKRYLKQVGLEGFETHKASELSSGQKQRLSIARALAKNTGIIVADEPTGNLDSETGEQIIRLLKELSKDRLVIMVTHNYDQAAAYVTRKIRLHDGNIISDVHVNQEAHAEALQEGGHDGEIEKQSSVRKKQEAVPDEMVEKAPKTHDAAGGKRAERWEEFRRQSRIASYFAAMNRRTQRGRAVLFTAFLFLVSIVSFLFIGELYLHSDDIFTKEYSTSVFSHEDSTRLVVKRADGEGITKKDVEKLYSVPNVRVVDSCGYSNDINYYIEKNKDYKYIFGENDGSGDAGDREIKSVTFLDKTHFMLSDDAVTKKDLAKGRLPEALDEIVLYSEDESVLDSEKLCYFSAQNIWGPNEYYGMNLTVVGILKEKTDQIYFSKELCQMLSVDMYHGKYQLLYDYQISIKDYRLKPAFYPVINKKLKGNQVRMSFKERDSNVPIPSGENLFRFQQYDENGLPVGDFIEQTVEVIKDKHEMTMDFMEVSEELFYTYFPKEQKCPQASVYLTSYAKINSVTKKLEKMGYEAQSTYQVGVTDYVQELVDERLVIIGISVFGLVAILLAQVLILRSLMKIRVKDYFVLKFIGMKMQIIRKISYFEIIAYSIAAMILSVVVMWILRLAGVPALQEMMWYYGFGAYLVFVVYNLVVSVLTVASFNHLLKGRLNA